MITLTSDRAVGPLLGQLRHDAGLTIAQVAQRAGLSPSGVHKRENARAGYVGILVDHAKALYYDVALIPQPVPGARLTGTGWPE